MQVLEIIGETEDRHDLGSDGDIETILARKAVADSTQRAHGAAQGAIVHVHHPAPGDAACIQAQRISPVNMIVQHGGEKVVGRTDGVKIPGEVQINVLHGHHLGITAAGRPALHAEAGSQAGLAQTHQSFLADAVEAIAQTHRGSGLTLSRRCRRNRRHQHQLASWPIFQGGDEFVGQLCLGGSVGQHRILGNAQIVADSPDG